MASCSLDPTWVLWTTETSVPPCGLLRPRQDPRHSRLCDEGAWQAGLSLFSHHSPVLAPQHPQKVLPSPCKDAQVRPLKTGSFL